MVRAGGAFLNARHSPEMADKALGGPSFSDVYVFPGGVRLPISATLAEAEKAGFDVRDVESLREHYVLTLRHWVRRLEEHAEEARSATDDVTYRVWRLFMSFSAHQFERGAIGVYQTLLIKPDGGRSGLPLTREDWYRDGP